MNQTSPRLFASKLAFALTALVMGSTCAPILAQQPPAAPSLVTVAGTAEIKVQPDTVHVSGAVESRDAELKVAREKNDKSIAAVLKVLKDSGIEAKDFQVSDVYIRPQYNSSNRFTHYQVTRRVQVTIRDVTKHEKLLVDVLGAGLNQVYDTSFSTSKFPEHRESARKLAVKVAAQKADTLTKELGVKRGKVWSIQENTDFGGGGSNSYRFTGNNVSNFANDAAPGGAEVQATGSTTALGSISVTTSVTVSFLIE